MTATRPLPLHPGPYFYEYRLYYSYLGGHFLPKKMLLYRALRFLKPKFFPKHNQPAPEL